MKHHEPRQYRTFLRTESHPVLRRVRWNELLGGAAGLTVLALATGGVGYALTQQLGSLFKSSAEIASSDQNQERAAAAFTLSNSVARENVAEVDSLISEGLRAQLRARRGEL
ncbi:MAG: hypothetical protein ABW321_03305 [Polyangiales bacterium]